MTDPFFGKAKVEDIKQWLYEKAEKLTVGLIMTHGKGFYWNDELHSSWPHDYDCAIQCFQAAAERGSIEAKHYLSICFQEGQGGDVNERKSFQLCLEAAECELPDDRNAPLHRAKARRRLGMMFWSGIGTKNDPERGLHWYEQARLPGDETFHTLFNQIVDTDIAVRQYEDGEVESAAELIKRIVEWPQLGGNSVALFFLGIMFRDGYGVEQNDFDAFECFQRGANNTWDYHPSFHMWEALPRCVVRCQFYCGRYLIEGTGCEPDPIDGVNWIRESAESGLAEGQFLLGLCLTDGIGTGVNLAEGISWLWKAAESGVGGAYQNLGVCYVLGEGVPRDRNEARRLFQLAIENGCEEARKDLARLDREDKKPSGGFWPYV